VHGWLRRGLSAAAPIPLQGLSFILSRALVLINFSYNNSRRKCHLLLNIRARCWMSRAFRLWPLDRELRSSALSGEIATIAIYLEDCFEEVIDALHHLLTPAQSLDTVLYQLSNTSIPDKHRSIWHDWFRGLSIRTERDRTSLAFLAGYCFASRPPTHRLPKRPSFVFWQILAGLRSEPSEWSSLGGYCD
jgi:hypothetical protein